MPPQQHCGPSGLIQQKYSWCDRNIPDVGALSEGSRAAPAMLYTTSPLSYSQEICLGISAYLQSMLHGSNGKCLLCYLQAEERAALGLSYFAGTHRFWSRKKTKVVSSPFCLPPQGEESMPIIYRSRKCLWVTAGRITRAPQNSPHLKGVGHHIPESSVKKKKKDRGKIKKNVTKIWGSIWEFAPKSS